MHLNSEPSCSQNVRIFSTLECDQHSFPQLYSLRLAMVLFSRVFLSASSLHQAEPLTPSCSCRVTETVPVTGFSASVAID